MAQLVQFANLVSAHARHARHREILTIRSLAFLGLLDCASERPGKIAGAALENVVASPAPECFGGGFFVRRFKDEDKRRIGRQALRHRQGSESTELRHGDAAEDYIRTVEFQLPREILGRLNASRFNSYARTDQLENLQIGDRFDILDDQDFIHLRSSQDEALPPPTSYRTARTFRQFSNSLGPEPHRRAGG